MSSGAGGAGGGPGVAPAVASSSAITSPPRRAATQAASQRTPRHDRHPPAPRPGERVHADHEHGQEQRAREQGKGPAGHHLADDQHVALGAVARGGRPGRRAVTVRRVARPSAPSRSSSIDSGGPFPAGEAPRCRRSGRRRSRARAAAPGRPRRSGRRGARADRTRRSPRPSGRAPGGSSRRRCAAARCPRGGSRSTRAGGTGRGARRAPRSDTTSTASTWEGASISSASLIAPTSPSVEPSVDASTRVLRVARPSNTRASSRSAAVSEALPAASGATAASRSATTTIWRRVRPARRPITFTRSRPACVKRSSCTRKPRSPRRAATSPAVARSPGLPAARSGFVGGDRGRAHGRRAAVEQHVRREPLGERPRPVLEGEHREHRRQKGRHERRPVNAGLDHALETIKTATYNLDGVGLLHPGSCSWTTRRQSRSC